MKYHSFANFCLSPFSEEFTLIKGFNYSIVVNMEKQSNDFMDNPVSTGVSSFNWSKFIKVKIQFNIPTFRLQLWLWSLQME